MARARALDWATVPLVFCSLAAACRREPPLPEAIPAPAETASGPRAPVKLRTRLRAPGSAPPSASAGASPSSSAAAASASSSAAAAGASTSAAAASASSSAAAASASSSAAAAGAIDQDNRAKPPTFDPETPARARVLFAALAASDPAQADEWFFPEGPFVHLKDSKDPKKYRALLLDRFHAGVRALIPRHGLWGRAEFVDLVVAGATWVPPGEEHNHIGYWRGRKVVLRYRFMGEPGEIVIDTLISWQGRWYVTHW